MSVKTPTPPAIPIRTADKCDLELRHHPGTGKPVLLVHGASASSDTFRINETRTLAAHLLAEGFDVWTLDWRASNRCADKVYCKNKLTDFTIDAAARNDVPAALEAMRTGQHVSDKISIVAHCMGGALVTQGIAQGFLGAELVGNVVITALGLFYRAAIDDVLKAQDGVLEELLNVTRQDLLHPTKRWAESVCDVDPGDGEWDRLLQEPYKIWSRTPLRHKCAVPICSRLSYMFGMPYMPDNIPTIHANDLPSQFGYIPVKFLLHCTQNLRRGWAAPFAGSARARSLCSDDTYLNHVPFQGRKLTLITGDLNSLWQRDSIDTMYEWLLRGRRSERPAIVRKYVLRGYGHQDLYWAAGAATDVFGHIVEGLKA